VVAKDTRAGPKGGGCGFDVKVRGGRGSQTRNWLKKREGIWQSVVSQGKIYTKKGKKNFQGTGERTG